MGFVVVLAATAWLASQHAPWWLVLGMFVSGASWLGLMYLLCVEQPSRLQRGQERRAVAAAGEQQRGSGDVARRR